MIFLLDDKWIQGYYRDVPNYREIDFISASNITHDAPFPTTSIASDLVGGSQILSAIPLSPNNRKQALGVTATTLSPTMCVPPRYANASANFEG
jgi:hypothetical protein